MPTAPTAGNPVSPKIRRRSVNPDDVRRLAAKGLSVVEIAAELDCDHPAISYAKRRHGIATAPAIRPLPGPCPFWAHNDDRLRTLIEGGATYAAAALALGVSKNAAVGRANRIGMTQPRVVSVVRPRRPRIEFPPPGGCLYGVGHIGDAGFHWCGARAEIGRPWCAQHLRQVFLPARKPAEIASALGGD